MIQEINKTVSVVWENETPEAVVIEKYGERISFTQQNDLIEITKEQAKDLIKILNKLIKD